MKRIVPEPNSAFAAPWHSQNVDVHTNGTSVTLFFYDKSKMIDVALS